ncbi:MAG: hypothetical protein B6I30_01805 [Desulfobacteraceae bacterium 4572_187]|nr:MAG: hypothetical protein B6I30_01805 [Desulfobacteraceae bacterium 4572_187]
MTLKSNLSVTGILHATRKKWRTELTFRDMFCFPEHVAFFIPDFKRSLFLSFQIGSCFILIGVSSSIW